MSSMISAKLKIKSLQQLKEALKVLGLKYTEAKNNTTVQMIGYNRNANVEIVIKKTDLIKNGKWGKYGDVGFVWNNNDECYDVLYDHYDKGFIDLLNQTYAFCTIKEMAKQNQYSFTVAGEIPNMQKQQVVTVEVF